MATVAACTLEEGLERAGTGRFQWSLLGIFGLVWAADAMQVLAIGFTAPSIAKSFGITVPEALQTGTTFFLGMLVGAWLFGQLADRWGRRRVLIVTVLLDAVFGLASAAAPDLTFLLVLRFLTGVAVGGTLPVDYALMAEFLPPQRRGRWLVMLEGFWAIGTIVVAVAAWIFATSGTAEPWRWIFVVTGVPALLGIGLRLWVPESPYYLTRNGRTREAEDVLRRIARSNGRDLAALDLKAAQRARAPAWALFRPDLKRSSLLILAGWFLVSAAYYGVFVWLPGQLVAGGHGFVRGYEFLIWVAVAQLPGYAIAAYGVEAWGRRATLVGFTLLSAAGCFLFTVVEGPFWVGAALLVMSFALLGTWGALYAYTPELYPTELRGTGMGTAGAMARLGGLLAPTAVAWLVVETGFTTAIAAFAALLLVSALATLAIRDETRGKGLA